MSDDFNKRLQQISELLGKEGMSQNLSSILSMLVPNSSTGEQSKGKEEHTENVYKDNTIKEEKSEKNKPDESMEMLRRVKTIMDDMKNANDPRVNLLTAIRPFLNSSRQKKVSDCIRLFQMTQLTRLMNENEKEKIFKEG